MLEIIQHIIGALTDSSITFYRKILTILFVLFIAFAANDLLSLSFNHRTDKRIEQLNALAKLVSPADTVVVQRDAATIVMQIRRHKPVLVRAEHLLVSVADNRISASQGIFIWKLLSAASLFIMGLIVTPLVEKDPKERSLAIAGIIVIAVPSIILLMLIPTFSRTWINYTLNVGLPGLLFMILYFADNSDDKKTETEQMIDKQMGNARIS